MVAFRRIPNTQTNYEGNTVRALFQLFMRIRISRDISKTTCHITAFLNLRFLFLQILKLIRWQRELNV